MGEGLSSSLRAEALIMALDLARVTRELEETAKAWNSATTALAAAQAECGRLRSGVTVGFIAPDYVQNLVAAARAEGFEAGRDAAAEWTEAHGYTVVGVGIRALKMEEPDAV